MAIDVNQDPASQRINENLNAHFASEVRDLDRAAERSKAQRAALLRPDNTPKWAPAEHTEREAAIAAEFEVAASRIVATAEEAIGEARRELTLLEGADPFDRLTPDEQQRAATRREIAKEDCELLSPPELVKRVRAALASNDRAALFLLDRYVGPRLDRDGARRDPALSTVHREIADRLADLQAKAKRDLAARRLSAAQVLAGHVNMARRGGIEGLLAEMRASGRYSL